MRAPQPARRRPRAAALAAAALLAAGCAGGPASLDLPYYWQSALGQMSLLQRARPIDELLADASLDPRLRARLQHALEIREFAARELGLPDNGSYTRYADLGRPFAVWSVFAAPELSMQLRQWCFPVAGCVSYRGYFDRDEAERYAATLRAEGWDVYVAGVPAYSTLGWFDDPVLNTFVNLPVAELARLVFHELAHQLVYVKGDSTFNESFATAVEEAGVERWLARLDDPAVESAYREFARRRRAFVQLLARHRQALEAVYAAGGSAQRMREGKAAVFESLRSEYRELRRSWGGWAGYDRWFAGELGNAHLASVATYHALVPAFRALLAGKGGDLPAFYAEVRALASLDAAARQGRLQALAGAGALSARPRGD